MNYPITIRIPIPLTHSRVRRITRPSRRLHRVTLPSPFSNPTPTTHAPFHSSLSSPTGTPFPLHRHPNHASSSPSNSSPASSLYIHSFRFPSDQSCSISSFFFSIFRGRNLLWGSLMICLQFRRRCCIRRRRGPCRSVRIVGARRPRRLSLMPGDGDTWSSIGGISGRRIGRKSPTPLILSMVIRRRLAGPMSSARIGLIR